ncbi:chitobiase/beta-hexosaminidase C-terminal domain-containing protein [Pectobacterium aquaticum]|uniref:chitobiase/beta-hexosaminidase C-terminal domain-containing protein n=1 Tax=Pectobacterium aquaticum TaxID=2204145 RepID=UPI001673A5B6|nr:chitobiase/beta-hexosaminidase C-terminal domain-containing protein [Pectobacterium aquaticum]
MAEIDNVSGKIYIANRTTDASIGYSIDGETWQIYTQAFSVPTGVKEIKIKAVRYGWKESEVVSVKL